MISHTQNRASALTAIIIRELDKLNRIRRYQKIPAINFDVLEIERLSDNCMGLLSAKKQIIKLVVEQAINMRKWEMTTLTLNIDINEDWREMENATKTWNNFHKYRSILLHSYFVNTV